MLTFWTRSHDFPDLSKQWQHDWLQNLFIWIHLSPSSYFGWKKFQMMMHSKKMALSTSSSKFQVVERCWNLLERTDFKSVLSNRDFAKEQRHLRSYLQLARSFKCKTCVGTEKRQDISLRQDLTTCEWMHLSLFCGWFQISPMLEHGQTFVCLNLTARAICMFMLNFQLPRMPNCLIETAESQKIRNRSSFLRPPEVPEASSLETG